MTTNKFEQKVLDIAESFMTTEKPSEPREFELVRSGISNAIWVRSTETAETNIDEIIDVIEKSAYDTLQSQHSLDQERILDLEAKYDVAKNLITGLQNDLSSLKQAALELAEFYGAKKNWKLDYDAKKCGIEESQYSLFNLSDMEEQNQSVSYCGKKAREFLTKYGKG